MSMKRVLTCLVMFVCLSVGVTWGWSINSPEIDASYFNSATIACSGTGFPNTNGEVAIKYGDVIMDSNAFTWGEESDFSCELEPPQSGWTEGVASVKLYNTSVTPKDLMASVNIVIVVPE